MPTFAELVRNHTDLTSTEVDWLGLLMADWQLLADLSFSDLVLWLPDREGRGFWAGAQMRPTTGPTAYVDDVVGTFVPVGRRPMWDRAYAEGRLVREGDAAWKDDVPVRVETIPVTTESRVIALIARSTNLIGVRTPSRLELAYMQTASDLSSMIARGHFPIPGQRSDHADTPRVGDGFLRVDPSGTVTYASPNAQSVYRRAGMTGDLVGGVLSRITRELIPPAEREDEELLSAVLGGRANHDLELTVNQVTLIVRSVRLRPEGDPAGALILVRDVTDLRRRDRELITKDATIREIHHRVKNNLQTVAALLRLQARRIDDGPARLALDEAVRRVGSIALVHETLSHTAEGSVEFDEIADRLAMMVAEMGSSAGAQVVVRRIATFGDLPSEVATALAVVLTEVFQNAVEHGYGYGARGGEIVVDPRPTPKGMRVTITDSGKGLPIEFDASSSNSLGMSIVRTLIESELGGEFRISSRTDGPGTEVVVEIPLVARQ